jgi:hypothetical protein
MKKNPIVLVLTVAAAVAITVAACKKTNSSDPNADFTTQSDDQSQFSGETDAVTNDVNVALEAVVAFNAKTSTNVICDATYSVDSNATAKGITITYNGTNCSGNRVRSGKVIATMLASAKWSDQGTTINIVYENVKVTRNLDKKSLLLNGQVNITNESGGKLANLSSLGSITHSINSPGLTVKFNNGSTLTWQIAKRRVYQYDNGIVVSETGTHDNNVSEWGVNRLGRDFTTSILEPLVIRQDCSWRLVGGTVKYHADYDMTMVFGLDMNGEPVSCPSGSYYFKLMWPGLRDTMHTIIWPY